MDLVLEVYKVSEQLPKEEKYGLRSQITRAAVSIPSNIAEGSSRDSDKGFKYFLEIAIGSAFELETQLLIVKRLNLTNPDRTTNLLEAVREVQKMINGFIKRLKA